MHVGHMLGQPQVVLRVRLVSDEPEEVKPREEGGWQLDVGLSRLLDVVAAVGWISSCQDGHAGIEGSHYTSLKMRERGETECNILSSF